MDLSYSKHFNTKFAPDILGADVMSNFKRENDKFQKQCVANSSSSSFFSSSPSCGFGEMRARMAAAVAEAERERSQKKYFAAKEERDREMETRAHHNMAQAQKGDKAYFEEKGKQRRAREQAKADAEREVYRKKGEARRAKERLEAEISDTVAEAVTTTIIPDVAGLISSLVNVVDPVERSSMEQTGRFVAGLIPIVREIELTERAMEIHVRRQTQIHNDSVQDYLDIGYNTEAAHAAAFRDTDFEGDSSNSALEAFIQRENNK
jgi:hypothetical protein